MLFLTDKQLTEIEQIIRDRFDLYLYQWIDPTLISPVTLERLRKKGLIPEVTARLPEESYKLGVLLEMLGVDKLAGMSFRDVRDYLRTADIVFTPIQTIAVNHVALTAGENIRGLGEQFVVNCVNLLREEDHNLMTTMQTARWKEARAATDLAALRRILSEGLDRGDLYNTMTLELGKSLSEGFDRDLSRIVRTELYDAMQYGQADYIDHTKGPDAAVFKLPLPTACRDCKNLFLHPDGSPIIFKLSFLRANSNHWKSRGQWMPTLTALHPHCFTEGTRLFTGTGIKTVKSLFESGDLVSVVVDNRVRNRKTWGGKNHQGEELSGGVWYHRHSSGTRFLSATAVFNTGIQECLNIEMDTGHVLEVSVGHEFWVDDDKSGLKVRADVLKVGDKIPLLSGPGGFGDDEFVDEAELMGNLLGDGCIVDPNAIWYFFGDDIPYGAVLKEKASRLSRRMNSDLAINEPDDKYSVQWARFNSTHLGRRFVEEFGLSKKPRRVPERIWTANKPTVAAFLRGLYAADGHGQREPAVVLAQNDREFLLEIQLLLANFGLLARLSNHTGEHVGNITYANGSNHDVNRKSCWRLIIGSWDQVDKFLREIGLGVPTKQQRAQDYLEDCAGKDKHGAWRTARIVTITKTGKKQTYCLTEPKTNTVCANGIVTGQCRCILVSLPSTKWIPLPSGELVMRSEAPVKQMNLGDLE